MRQTVQTRAQREKPLYCPECGSELSVELLVVENESGPESVLFIDCLNGDYHAAVTEKDIVELTTKVVMERLRQL